LHGRFSSHQPPRFHQNHYSGSGYGYWCGNWPAIHRFSDRSSPQSSQDRSKVNGWEKTVNSYGVFVLRTADTEPLVLSNKCTHLGCHVNWDADKQEYICPCHDAQFGINGDVLGGPPPRPLERYSGDQVKVEDGTLLIHFLEG
jgi:Rieske Fe-S protein